MNRSTAYLHIESIAGEVLPEPVASQLTANESFMEKHYDGLIKAVSVVDPDGTAYTASENAIATYSDSIRNDLQTRFPKVFRHQV
ncbi:hypothetical protein OPIT5_00150 (plasmid) [Opitutaceae bacterium TAV5]|nr:hypothetical protein OPIT5_00150 [Opitutaceae bacterium TAV5]